MEPTQATPKIALVSLGLLGQWYCISTDTPEDEILAILKAESGMPVSSVDLIRDRLFGGFICASGDKHRHVYLNSGAYTYLHPEANMPLSAEDRLETWNEIIEASKDHGFYIGGGPFCEDAPPIQAENANA